MFYSIDDDYEMNVELKRICVLVRRDELQLQSKCIKPILVG